MPQPTLSDVHVNRPLTVLSVGYVQDMSDFAAQTVFPPVPVTNRSDSYFKYNRGDFFRNNMQKRGPSAKAAAGGYKLATDTYTADVWAEMYPISDQIRANSDQPLQPDRDGTYFLTQQAMINREVSWASAFFNTGIWNTEKAGQATADATHVVYWNLSGSTPIEDVLAGHLKVKQTTGYWPNTLVLSAQAYVALLTNPEIIDRLKYGQTAPGPVVVSTSDLAQLFKVNRVVVAGGVQTTSAETETNDADLDNLLTIDFIQGKHALLAYAAPSPSIMAPSAGYTFNWTGLMGSTAAGMRIKKYRWEEEAGDRLEVESSYAFGLVSKFLGYFFYNVVQ